MKKFNKTLFWGVCAIGILMLTGCGDKQKDLQQAVDNKDVAKIKELIKNGADVNYKGKSGNSSTLLHIALQKDLKTLKALVDAGIKVDQSDKWQRGFMARCISGSNEKRNIEKIKLLKLAGAGINDQGGMDDKTVLMQAASVGHLKTVMFLLANGADPNLKNNKGKTAYDLAFKKHSKDKVQKVLVYFESKGIISPDKATMELRKKDLEKIAAKRRIAEAKRKAPRSIIAYKFIKYDPVKKAALIEVENKTNKTIMTYSGVIFIRRSGKIIYCCGATDAQPNAIAFKPHDKKQWYLSSSAMGFSKNANVDFSKEGNQLVYEFVMNKVAFKDGTKKVFK
jgi:hypothetical protein